MQTESLVIASKPEPRRAAVRPIGLRSDEDARIQWAARQRGVNITEFIRQAALAAATPHEFIAQSLVTGPHNEAGSVQAHERLAALVRCGELLGGTSNGYVAYDDATEAWRLTAWWDFCAADAQADRLRAQVDLAVRGLADQWHTEST